MGKLYGGLRMTTSHTEGKLNWNLLNASLQLSFCHSLLVLRGFVNTYFWNLKQNPYRQVKRYGEEIQTYDIS